MSVDLVNDLLVAASEEARLARIEEEYNSMVGELNQQYFAMMAADDDAGMYGRMV